MKKFINFVIPIFIFIFTLAIYIITLSRFIYPGDSGEFITVAKTLGIAHPPGYPLYTMLAHLFTYLPFNNLAFKVNLFSAVTSSLTIVIVYFIGLKLTKNRLAALTASLFLAFSYLFWLYSLVADSYSLNALFIAIIVLISIHLFENPHSRKLFWLLSFAMGLSLTHHPTILLLIPALIFLFISKKQREILKTNNLLLAALLFGVGLFPFLYLPIRAMQNPILNWGDPDTLGNFFHLVLRKDYGTFSTGAGAAANPFDFELLTFYSSSLISHFTIIGIIVAVIGFLFFPKTKAYFFLLVAFIFLGPILISLTKIPIAGNIDAKGAVQELMTPSLVTFGLFIAFGLSEIFKRTPKSLSLPAKSLVLLFLIPLVLSFPKVDQSKNSIYEDFGRKTFEFLPQNSVVFVHDDMVSMISKYLQIVEGRRSDLKIINITLITDDWYKSSLKQLHPEFPFPYDKFQPLKLSEVEAGEIICREVLPKYPVFIEERTKGFDPKLNQHCTNRLYKTLWKLEQKDFRSSTRLLIDDYENFWKPQIESLSQNRPYDFRTRAILLNSITQPLTYLGFNLENNFLYKDKAHQIYQDAFAISGDNAVALHLSARKYLDEKDFETAVKIEKKAIQIDPTQQEPYKILAAIYFNEKDDRDQALIYMQKYFELLSPGKERAEAEKIIKQLESGR